MSAQPPQSPQPPRPRHHGAATWPAPGSSARRRRLAVLIPALVLAPVMLVACKVDVDADTENSNTNAYEVSGKVTKLSVVTTAGKVTVTEQDVQAVKVTENRHWESGTEPTTSHNVTDGTLKLDYKCAKSDCWVSYDVIVPRGTAAHVETDAGEVKLTGLSGAIDASTTAGKLTGTGLTAKQAVARTSAGSLDLGFTAAPDSVDAKTTAGRATVRVPGNQSYNVDVDATIGDTDVKVPKDANSSHKVTVRTTAGQARVLAS
ncbi:DUF4097 family beta strand repeat-containing protein [Yinghuangia seranimata]|uniref:DUF4097 family beta strand repeat-containing protein n=1 Tax=Yinghuangia seranimata TaxID=408067 RepID=UPI00248B8DAC|nr:DUF4097 family beta strand repeat-containing protein [Yinghuangia seranimata]MDI2128635.1 DUF4097 family beta strand repeat-containing protein [Yinghuangia seranimata]